MAHVLSVAAFNPVSVSAKITEFVAAHTAAAAQRKLYRKTLNELSALSDRELDDLGMSRPNLEMIAYQAVYSA